MYFLVGYDGLITIYFFHPTGIMPKTILKASHDFYFNRQHETLSGDNAKDYIKGLAPWIKDEQIGYDTKMDPVDVFGTHTPFPQFHWKCRMKTIIV